MTLKQNLSIRVFLLLVLTELLSIYAWGLPVFNMACFGVMVLLTLVLSLKDLRHGIYIALVELIIGSHGYLFSLSIGAGQTLISIRMGIFAAVMLAWVIRAIGKEGLAAWFERLKGFKFFKYYVYLAIILLWGFLWGIIRGNDFGNLFLDFNNWLFFLYLLPVFDAVGSENFWHDLKLVLMAALSWLVVKTVIFLYIFSHQFIWALPELYQWIRDTRVGEITMMSNNFYRIFSQSQIYALLGFFVLLPFLEYRRWKIEFRKNSIQYHSTIFYILYSIFCLAAVIISFSRSFWMGLIGGLTAYCLLLTVYHRVGLKKFFKQAIIILSAGIISTAIIFLIINLPPKISGKDLGSLISERATRIEAAGSSRINMLQPLLRAITKHPIIGSGFGTTVTYKSVDPRILTTTAGASGDYTTYAFEWSYLDLLLKVGLVGAAVYLLLIFKILQTMWQQINFQFSIFNFQTISNDSISNDKNNYKLHITNYKLQLGLVLALLSLLIVNIFTPYLNHPLGIGFIILISVLANNNCHCYENINHNRHL